MHHRKGSVGGPGPCSFVSSAGWYTAAMRQTVLLLVVMLSGCSAPSWVADITNVVLDPGPPTTKNFFEVISSLF